MQTAFAQATPVPQRPGSPGYDALLDAATAPAAGTFDGRVRVRVERLDRLGPWAFLLGTLEGAGGGRPDYAGTVYAGRAAEGGMSDVYVALLRHDGEGDAGGWTLLDHAIGPGDVAWLPWPERHAAPRQLFGF